MIAQNDQPGVCGLCLRRVPPDVMTLHHLTPRQKGGKAEHRTPVCRPCHKQLHATFSNAELAKRYASLAALRTAPELQSFLQWVRKQNPRRVFRTHMSGSHPHKRRR